MVIIYYSDFGSACSSNHRSIFLAQFHELFTQTLFLSTGARVDVVKQRAGGDSASEPFSLSKSDYKGCEYILNFSIREFFTD